MVSFVSDVTQLFVVLVGIVFDALGVKGSSEQQWYIVVGLLALVAFL